MKRQRQRRKHRFSFSHARSLHVENLEDRRMLSGVPSDFNGHDADDYDRWSGEVVQLANRIPDYCTFGGDTSCNTDDLDALYAVFNTHVPLTDPLFDLNSDTVVEEADLDLWLNLAAVENGYFSPYLRGDTDLDHDVDTFDLTQMIINYTGAVGSGTTWTTGDIDGDKDTDTVDLTKAIMNFTGATMPPVNNVPTLDPISDVTIDEDAPQQTVGLTGIYLPRMTTSDHQLVTSNAVAISVENSEVSDDVNITVTDNSTPVTLSFQDGLFPSPSYTGTRDVQILRTNSNTNFGSSQQLEADGKPDSASLLKWDLSAIAPGSTISAASIQLNITNSTKHNYELYALQRDWSESQATWKKYATGEKWSTAGANGTGDFNPTVLGQFAAKNMGTYMSSLNAAGVAIVQSWVDHASTNHGLIAKDYVKATNGMAFSSRETSTASLHPKLVVSYISGDTPTNEPPVVNAGEDQTINVSSLALLNGTASDDGNPNPPGEVTSSWSKVSGPGNVVFNDPTAVVTNAQFDTAGTYVLRLTTDDGELQAQDNVTVAVEQPVTNQPPVVSAGEDQTINVSSLVLLNGTASDDGNPNPPGEVTSSWSKVSGPGNVVFNDPTAVVTNAQFDTSGTYVLRLTTDDSQQVTSDDVNITVTDNSTPVTLSFQDGLFPSPSYTGTRDVQILRANSNTNFGSSQQLEADGKPDSASLLKWDLSAIAPGSTISAASIQLNITNSTKHNYELYALQRDWSESQATWKQYATGEKWSTAGANGTGDFNPTVLGQFAAKNMGTYTSSLNAAGVAIVQSWVDHASTNHGLIAKDYVKATNGMAFSSRETSTASLHPKLVVSYISGDTPTNEPPVVNAGEDQTINVSSLALLNGTASDDGNPNPPGEVTSSWSKVSGPGNVVFNDPTAVVTNAQFDTAGTYVLRLTTDDGELQAQDNVTVAVEQPVTNQPPVVSAGEDQTINVSSLALLNGTASDDGNPNPPGEVTSSWSKVSGPGNVVFNDPTAVVTNAQFDTAGTYVLRLTTDDGELQAQDNVTVAVEQPVTNQPPVVSAGEDQTINVSSLALLNGTASDDGNPNPPGAVTSSWSKVSGPGNVVFNDPTAVVTNAQFDTAGTYVLRLTTDDSQQVTSDDVNITVTDNSTPVTLSFQDGLFPSPSYTGTRDVQILRTNSNTNFGSSQQLEADGKPDSASLLKWDLSAIAPGSTISAASIQLNITNSTKHNYELYALQRDWSESQATWKKYATGEKWSTAGANGTGDFNPTVLGQFAAKNMGTYMSSLNAAGVAIVQSWVDHASTNHGLIAKDYVKATNGMAFSSRETSTASLHPKLVVSYISGDTPTNEPPVVNAGEDQTINVSSLALLNGTANDDGNPNPPGEVTSSWSKVSGPGNVVFNDPTAVVTNAQFDTAGTYVLRLTTDDGELQAQDNVTVAVEQPVTNQPSINVGIHNLNADMPHQIIQIDIAGVDVAQGVNFNIQVADGGPEAGGSILGPKITRIDIVGETLGGLTIFTGNNTGQTDTLVLPQIWESTTTTSSETVTPNGVLGFVEIDTTGFFNSAIFDLIMSNTLNYPTDLAGIPVDVTDGKIIITPLFSAGDD